MPNKEAKTIAKALLTNFILVYGPMKKIITDMGTEFINQTWRELVTLLSIEHAHSTPYHHQTLGTIERSHRTLNEYLRSYLKVDRSDWDEWMKYFTYCFNTTPSSVHGYCPFELVFGKSPSQYEFLRTNSVDPVYNMDAYYLETKFRLQNTYARARELPQKSKLARKIHFDKHINPLEISINDLVLVENEPRAKFDPVFKRPFKVIKKNPPNCTIVDGNKEFEIHLNRVKKYNK